MSTPFAATLINAVANEIELIGRSAGAEEVFFAPTEVGHNEAYVGAERGRLDAGDHLLLHAQQSRARRLAICASSLSTSFL